MMMKGQLQIVVMYLSKTTQPPQYLLQPEENPHILKNEKLDTLNVIFHFIFRVPEPAQLDLKESTFTMTPQCLMSKTITTYKNKRIKNIRPIKCQIYKNQFSLINKT